MWLLAVSVPAKAEKHGLHPPGHMPFLVALLRVCHVAISPPFYLFQIAAPLDKRRKDLHGKIRKVRGGGIPRAA